MQTHGTIEERGGRVEGTAGARLERNSEELESICAIIVCRVAFGFPALDLRNRAPLSRVTPVLQGRFGMGEGSGWGRHISRHSPPPATCNCCAAPQSTGSIHSHTPPCTCTLVLLRNHAGPSRGRGATRHDDPSGSAAGGGSLDVLCRRRPLPGTALVRRSSAAAVQYPTLAPPWA